MQLDRAKTILRLALPIIGGMCSQNILNTVDTAFVGQLGKAALGGVGIGGIATWLFLAVLVSLSAAVQAYTARRIGEGETKRAAMGLKVALVMAAGLGSLVALGGWLCAEPLFARISEDPAVRLIGAEYLQVRLLVAPITVCTFAFHGFWNGVGQSRRYLMVLLIMHSANAMLDWLLIFGNWGAPELGATGAAVATALSQGLGFVVYVVMTLRDGAQFGFRSPKLSLDAAKTIGRVALPSGLQQATFSAGFLVIFSVAARIDTEAVALTHVLTNLMLLCVLPSVGFGVAGATLVGQALGADDEPGALAWGRDISRIGCVVMVTIGLILAIGGEHWLAIFLGEEPALIEVGRLPLALIGLTQGLDAFGVMFKQMMARTGDTVAMFRISASIQWGLFLPALWLSCVVFNNGVVTLWALLISWRLLEATAMTLRWRSRRWIAAAQV